MKKFALILALAAVRCASAAITIPTSKAELTTSLNNQKAAATKAVSDKIAAQKAADKAKADAAKKATEDLQKQLDAAKQQADVATAKVQEAELKLVAAQKQLQLASPDAAVFKTLFAQVQEDFNRLQGALLKVQQADPATGEKLRKAVETLLTKLAGDVSGS